MTVHYAAPERYGSDYYMPSDVYSFGVMLYEIVTERNAFEGLKPEQIMSKVVSGDRPVFPPGVSKFAKELVTRCWSQKASERPTFEEICKELEENGKSLFATLNLSEFLCAKLGLDKST